MLRLRRLLLSLPALVLLMFLLAPVTASACARCYYDPVCECWRCSFALFTACNPDFLSCDENQPCGGLAAKQAAPGGGPTQAACSEVPRLGQAETERIQPVMVLAVRRLPERT